MSQFVYIFVFMLEIIIPDPEKLVFCKLWGGGGESIFQICLYLSILPRVSYSQNINTFFLKFPGIPSSADDAKFSPRLRQPESPRFFGCSKRWCNGVGKVGNDRFFRVGMALSHCDQFSCLRHLVRERARSMDPIE